MIYNKINKKGFTLMELLVTVILVAILASYAVYYYTNTMREGNLNSAKGKLAALGGAVERFKIEYGDPGHEREVVFNASNIVGGTCDYNSSEYATKVLSIFRCGYVEKSLGLDNNFIFSFGSPAHCGASSDFTTVLMRPIDSSIDLYPACAYFNPNTDKVIEVRN